MTLQLGWFAEDFKLISSFRQRIWRKVAQKLINAQDIEITRDQLYAIEEEKDSSNWIRIVLPHGLHTGHELLGHNNSIGDGLEDAKSQSFYFVGFFGTRSLYKASSDEVCSDSTDIDNKLMQELRQNPYILCYATMSRNRLEETFNVVICTSEEAISLWRKSANHETAVCSISPRYYSTVRIHMGRFTTEEQGDEYEVFRTTFLDYTVDGKTHRHVQQWRNEDIARDVSRNKLKVIM